MLKIVAALLLGSAVIANAGPKDGATPPAPECLSTPSVRKAYEQGAPVLVVPRDNPSPRAAGPGADAGHPGDALRCMVPAAVCGPPWKPESCERCEGGECVKLAGARKQPPARGERLAAPMVIELPAQGAPDRKPRLQGLLLPSASTASTASTVSARGSIVWVLQECRPTADCDPHPALKDFAARSTQPAPAILAKDPALQEQLTRELFGPSH